jgi:hypothetical protein
MSRIIVHLPVLLSLLASAGFLLCAFAYALWFLIPFWQFLCIAVMLILDGKNRMARYRKIRRLMDRGVPLDALPREHTICGFFIRAAAVIEIRPVRAG